MSTADLPISDIENPTLALGDHKVANQSRLVRFLVVLLILSFVPFAGLKPTQFVLLLLTTGLFLFRVPRSTVPTGWLYFTIVTITVSQAIGVASNTAAQRNLVRPGGLPFFLLVGVLARKFGEATKIESRGALIARISNWLLWFFGIELVSRLIFSPYIHQNYVVEELFNGGLAENDPAFYRYKMSIFFGDANNVGMALLCLLALMLVFHEYVGTRRIIIGYLLILATISRASIFAALCQLLIFKAWKYRRWVLSAGFIIGPIVVIGMLSTYLSAGPDVFRDVDGSLASKLLLLQIMLDWYPAASLPLKLFGLGAGNSDAMFNIAAQNIVVTFATEFGIVGSILLISYVWQLCRKSAPDRYLLVAPMIINGFALLLPSTPYFYIVLGLLGGVPAFPARNAQSST